MTQGPRRAIWPDEEPSGFTAAGFSTQWAPPAPGQQPVWAPPAPGQQPVDPLYRPAAARRRLPTAAKALLIAIVLMIATATIVWAAGGFEERQTVVNRQPGELLDLGPVELTVDKAISYDLGEQAKIEVSGTCRLTSAHSEGSIHFSIGRNTIAGVRLDDRIVVSTEAMMSLGIDDDSKYSGSTREALAPNVPAVPCVTRYSLPLEALDGEDTVIVLFWKLQFTEQNNVKNERDSSKTWNATSDGYRIELPVRHVKR